MASDTTVRVALVEERTIDGANSQVPIYFVFEALSGSKLLYSEMEKLIYAIVIAKLKLRKYFEAHHIVVPMSYPLKDIIHNRVLAKNSEVGSKASRIYKERPSSHKFWQTSMQRGHQDLKIG